MLLGAYNYIARDSDNRCMHQALDYYIVQCYRYYHTSTFDQMCGGMVPKRVRPICLHSLRTRTLLELQQRKLLLGMRRRFVPGTVSDRKPPCAA